MILINSIFIDLTIKYNLTVRTITMESRKIKMVNGFYGIWVEIK